MIKKLLMFCTVFMAGTAMMTAQITSMGIIGSATPTGWDSDTDMTTTDGVTYTIENFTLTTGAVKFRSNDSWDAGDDWGGTTFPSGTGILNTNGVDIPVQAGLYDITFNVTTLHYNFEDVGGFDVIALTGAGLSFQLSTTDGIHYFYNNAVVATAGNMAFTTGAQSWGSTGFPTGAATNGGAQIPVPANSYNITFNAETGAYAFNYVIISLTGDAVGGWGTDVNLSTTDGVNYMVANQAFTAAQVKFRLNNAWGTTWGNATFPSGTAEVVADGGNMDIPAGSYDVSFNRMTGAFAFTAPTAGIADFKAGVIAVYPNPSATAWTFNAGNNAISNIRITDVTGKTVYTTTINANVTTVDASGLASGIYFAKLTAGTAVQTVRVVKN